MTRCAACGTPLWNEGDLCPHHQRADTEWATANRVFCDLIHRGIEPAPVVLEVLDEWPGAA